MKKLKLFIMIALSIAIILVVYMVRFNKNKEVPEESDNLEQSKQESNQKESGEVLLTIQSGTIAGMYEDGISIYKAIPYAKPPLDELRFAPPQDEEPWEGVLSCKEFGATAIQPFARDHLPMSEDCLTLNVWTCAKQGTLEKLPVFVWIHGGAFVGGTGADSSYDGVNFAKKGMVVVTINYRLNTLGYMASKETFNQYGTTGNWGTLDQIKALEWVQKNIAAFGGDPNRVTVGGQSAGAYSVSGLILSSLATGLFQSAIMESGSILSVLANNQYDGSNIEESIKNTDNLMRKYGIEDDEKGLTQLRQLDANLVTKTFPENMGLEKEVAGLYLLSPVLDGHVFPKEPVKKLKNGQFNNVKLLFGYNTDEGSIFISQANKSQYKALTVRLFGEQKAADVRKHFPVDAEHSSLERSREILDYSLFCGGMKMFADALSKKGQDVYGYHFAYENETDRKSGLGVRHGAELAYVFHNISADKSSDYDRSLAEDIHIRWANFIKNGDPNKGDSWPSNVEWPNYGGGGANMLRFEREIKKEAMHNLEDMEFMEDIMFENH